MSESSSVDPPPRSDASRPLRNNVADLLTVVALLAGIPLIALGISRVRLENNVEDWLPRGNRGALVLDWHHEHFDPSERFLVSWDSSSLDDPRVERLAEELAEPRDAEGTRLGRFPEIERVSTPRDLLWQMRNNGVERDDAIERIVGVAIGKGFLKVRLTDAAKEDRATAEKLILDRLSELILEPQLLPPTPQSSPTVKSAASSGAEEALVPDTLLEIPPHDFQVRWKGMTPADSRAAEVRESLESLVNRGRKLVDQTFFAAGAPAGVTVILTPQGSKSVSETVQIVDDAAERAGIPTEELHYGGGPIGRSRLNREGMRALWNEEYPAWNVFKRSPVLLSTLVGAIVAFLCLRNLRATVIVLFSAVYVAAATVAIVPLFGDTLSMVLIVMPNLLFVITVSGAIHIVNYWRSAALKDRATAVNKAVREAAIPCVFASVTTAIGVLSLMTSPLTPIRQFGMYSTIGVLASMVMVLQGVPALVSLAGGVPNHRHQSSHRFWRKAGRVTSRYHLAIQFVMALITIHAVWGLAGFKSEAKVIRYFPDHLKIIRDYEFFEASLAGVVNIDVILHFNTGGDTEDSGNSPRSPVELDVAQRMELVRQAERLIRNQNGVTGTLSVADFRREISTPPRSAPLPVKVLYRTGMRRLHAGIFGDAPPTGAPADLTTSTTERRAARSLAALAQRPLKLDDAEDPVDIEPGDEAWRIRVQCTVLEDVDYGTLLQDIQRRVEHAIEGQPGVDYLVTGSVPLFLRAQRALLDSLIRSFGLALCVITVAMMIFVRSVSGGVLAMLPNIFPIAVTFGWLSWARIPVDIGTMMTASIALGIAVDGTFHLITWYLKFVPANRHRSDAVRDAMDHCGPPLLQTTMVISLGMLMLTGSDLLLISRFGYVMALLIVTALIGDVILLPSLLTSYLGGVVQPLSLAKRRSQKKEFRRPALAASMHSDSDGANGEAQ